LLVLPLLLTLGFWQLDRARQKTELQTAFIERFQQPPSPLTSIDPSDPNNRYRPVVVTGRYDGRQQLLLDNQVHDGQPGYHVLTPLRLLDGKAILINRGWLPIGASRTILPDVTVVDGQPVTVTGWLSQAANPGLWWGGATGENGQWPRVIPYVEYERLTELLGYPLQSAVVLLNPEAAAGYWREWQPRFGGTGPERHRAYAVQWFGLAVTLLILYIASNTQRVLHPT
jgi:surfeit locus 1 family protein